MHILPAVALWKEELLTVSLPDFRQEVIVEEGVCVVIGLPVPLSAGEGVVHILRPGVDYALAARVRLEGDLCARKCLDSAVTEFTRGNGKGGDVVDVM